MPAVRMVGYGATLQITGRASAAALRFQIDQPRIAQLRRGQHHQRRAGARSAPSACCKSMRLRIEI
jgi:hypothetical protein